MTPSGTLRTAILAVIGLALAVAVGLAANAISRDSIGLAPTPVGSGVRLAPAKNPATTRPPSKASQPAKKTTTTNKATTPKPSTGTTTTPTTRTPTTTSGGDDHGGRGGGSGSSGSGSSGGSGSTPGGSGSGGSGKGRGGGDD